VRLVAGAACAVLAAGCTGSLFQSKAAPASVYLLSARIDAPAAAALLQADLVVLRPRIRKGLETDRIAVLYPDRRLDYFADALWSGPLDDVLQDLAVQAFHSGAHLRNVSADTSAFAGGNWLEIEVVDFQAEYASVSAGAPTIHVHLLARLGSAGDRHIIATVDADALQPATDNRLTAIVDAYEKAVDTALATIVAGTTRALATS
jgi:cholesterol transport system auxiliary component